MKTEDQIKALAELDGWKFTRKTISGIDCYTRDGLIGDFMVQHLSQYLTSYDAIIPLVRKQSWHIHQKIWLDLCFMLKSQHIFIATPAQLCEALLKATGRWTE